MSSSLKEKTISGIGWSFTDNFFNLGINFVIGVILARLLSPSEFGLIGMLAIFIAVSQSFVDSGFSQALIRKQDCSEKDYSTVFYYNLAVGIIIYLILFFSANAIANFFQEPKLVALVRVLSLSLIIKSVGIIQIAILTKRIDFKLKAKISIIASVLSGAVAIGMAYQGFGVWSLVFRTLLLNLFTIGLLWLWNSWRPKLVFSLDSFRELFGFGSKLMLAGLLNTIHENIYYLIIGRFFAPADLGFYKRAEEFKKLPSEKLNQIVSKVSYPVLSSVQDEQLKLKSGYKKIIKSTMFISFTSMIGLSVVAKPMVVTLIGEQWLPTVPFLQLMCFAGMLYPLHALNLNMLKVKGRSDLLLKLEIIKRVLSIPIILIAIYVGIIEMLIGKIVISLIGYFLNSYWSGKMVNYPPKEQLMDIAPSFLIAITMGISVFALGNVLMLEPVLLLSAQVVVGVLIVLGISELIKFGTYFEIKEIAMGYLGKATKSLKSIYK